MNISPAQAVALGVAAYLLIVFLDFGLTYIAKQIKKETDLERADDEIVKNAKIWLDGFNEIIKARKVDEAEGTIDEAVKTALAKLAINHKIEKLK